MQSQEPHGFPLAAGLTGSAKHNAVGSEAKSEVRTPGREEQNQAEMEQGWRGATELWVSASAQQDAGLSQGLGMGKGRTNHHLLAPSRRSGPRLAAEQPGCLWGMRGT